MDVTVIGGGLFGLSTARELARRNHSVCVLEAGPMPSPLAASHDVSKAFRLPYGQETEIWAPRVLESIGLWHDLEQEVGKTLLHHTGFVALSTTFRSGNFEYESARALDSLELPHEVLEPEHIRKRWPAIASSDIDRAVFDPQGGWFDPVSAVKALATSAVRAGVLLKSEQGPVDPAEVKADAVVISMGSWLAHADFTLPFAVRSTLQHEFLFRSREGCAEEARSIPVWSYDLAGKGFYGFCRHPDGHFKVATHRLGIESNPNDNRPPPEKEEVDEARGVVRQLLPSLDPESFETRQCFYTMSPDGNFLFDSVPERDGWFVAGCGGGHGFKFGPLLGIWGANLVEGKDVPEEFRAGKRQGDRVV